MALYLVDRIVEDEPVFILCGFIHAFGRTNAPLEAVNRKPIVPQESEIALNTRARSAKLRIAERRAGK